MNKYQEELLEQSSKLISTEFLEGKVSWESPSNIAIVKYWGKRQNQIPTNPSLSFSLDRSKTKTTIEFQKSKKQSGKPALQFLFEGKENTSFQTRIEMFLNSIRPYFPFLDNLELNIQSENTFPHSAGIASSASSLSSIALCLCTIENNLFSTLSNNEDFYRKASLISRLGSGSASRSVYPHWVLWGQNEFFKGSSDQYAIPISKIHQDFKEINDTVLLVSSAKKSISSSKGHDLMNNHIFSSSRIEMANNNCMDLISVLKSGDLFKFIEIAENEALTLHALMMSSKPGYLLLQPNSIVMIEKIQAFRKASKVPVGFTIDAGPNIHLLYFSKNKKQVDDFVKSELVGYCENERWIDDKIGEGPKHIF